MDIFNIYMLIENDPFISQQFKGRDVNFLACREKQTLAFDSAIQNQFCTNSSSVTNSLTKEEVQSEGLVTLTINGTGAKRHTLHIAVIFLSPKS
jgi:hypothetical protein